MHFKKIVQINVLLILLVNFLNANEANKKESVKSTYISIGVDLESISGYSSYGYSSTISIGDTNLFIPKLGLEAFISKTLLNSTTEDSLTVLSTITNWTTSTNMQNYGLLLTYAIGDKREN